MTFPVPGNKDNVLPLPLAGGGSAEGAVGLELPPPPNPLSQGEGKPCRDRHDPSRSPLRRDLRRREVSLASGLQVIPALREAGFEVTAIEVGKDIAAVIAALTPRPDAVFNALHGRFGEDGAIQGVLDWLAIPYTHSGVRASALAMDKVAAKAIFAAAGLPIARGRVVATDELEAGDPMPLPYVVKPVSEGSRSASRSSGSATTAAPKSREPGASAMRHWSRNTSPAANSLSASWAIARSR